MQLRYGFVLMLLLAGCATRPEFGKPGPVNSEFTRTLATEYTTLANYEGQALHDPKIAAYFEHKTAEARDGKMPLPDDPNTVEVPAESKDRIQNAYTILVSSLQKGSWIDNGALAGMAQSRFDCWLSMQMVLKTPEAGAGCHDKFQEAMDMLAPPKPESAIYPVAFVQDGIAVDEAGNAMVRQAARSVRSQPDWAIVLNGYTDPSETGENDNNLAVRRAMAVRNALIQDGVDADDIVVADPSHLPPAQLAAVTRRVDIQVMPKAQADQLASTAAVQQLPENSRSTKPVF